MRAEPRQIVQADHLGLDAEMLVDLRPPAHRPQGGIGMGERQMAALGIEDVEVELAGEAAEQADRLVVEPHPFGRQVVGTDDSRVARRVAAAEPALVEHRDVGDAVILGEIVGGGEPVPAGADYRHVVARPEPDRGRQRAARPALAAEPVPDQPERHGGGRHPSRRSCAVEMAKAVTPDLFRGPGLPRTAIRGKPGEDRACGPGPRNKSGVTIGGVATGAFMHLPVVRNPGSRRRACGRTPIARARSCSSAIRPA